MTTPTDPYAEVAAIEQTALNAFKAKLEAFVADVNTIAAPLGSGTPSTPARVFFAGQQMNLAAITMSLPTVMAQSGIVSDPGNAPG